ncbi:MAG: amidohydrolase family protein, partial [Candidatus Binatia bacterium]|nr:amidohydrolase family protein [Candidatus Binatia bacterium]
MVSDAGYSGRMTLLRAARLMDGRGGAPLEPSALLIDGKRIAAVGNPQKVKAPPDTRVIDVGDRTLLPGL